MFSIYGETILDEINQGILNRSSLAAAEVSKVQILDPMWQNIFKANTSLSMVKKQNQW